MAMRYDESSPQKHSVSDPNRMMQSTGAEHGEKQKRMILAMLRYTGMQDGISVVLGQWPNFGVGLKVVKKNISTRLRSSLGTHPCRNQIDC